jgi:branched-chain amino acid transport system substrate-binding protein
MRRGCALALAAVLVALAAPPAAGQAPIRIGASLSLTGSYAKLGAYQREGYALCEQHLNDGGGLLGRPVAFVLYDDQSSPATGVRLYERLITEDRVDAVMGPYSSPITEAVAGVTEKYRKVMVSPLAATTSIFRKGRRYVFMVISPAEVYLEGLVDLAVRRGLATVAIVNEDTLFAKSAAAGAAELARRRGLRVVLHEAYPKGHADFSALLVKVKARRPDILAAATYFDDAVALARQMRELDVNPKMFGVTVGGDLPEFQAVLGPAAEFVYGASQWEPTLSYPGQREFVETYKSRFRREPVYHAAAGYAGCQIYAEAVRRAGSLDAERVRAELLRMELRTAFGDFRVDADGYQVAHRMVLLQWQDGRRVVVWPDDLAAGAPRFPTPPWRQR